MVIIYQAFAAASRKVQALRLRLNRRLEMKKSVFTTRGGNNRVAGTKYPGDVKYCTDTYPCPKNLLGSHLTAPSISGKVEFEKCYF